MTKYIEEKKTYDSVCIEFISISNQKQGQNILQLRKKGFSRFYCRNYDNMDDIEKCEDSLTHRHDGLLFLHFFSAFNKYFLLKVLGANFLNGLGGALSLFLGVSFILIFELVELALDVLMNLINLSRGLPLGRKHHVL